MPFRDDVTLLDIAIACRRIEGFLRDVDADTFRTDELRQSAVIHQLLVLGEAVKRLSKEFRDLHRTIPWGVIARVRDRLFHAYDSVDLDLVSEAAFRDVPDLMKRIEPLLPKENG
jgi:uncharacterized protein with HEPN domain